MMNSISLEMDSALRGGRHHPPLIPDKLGRLLRRSDDGAGDEAGRVDEHDVAGVESGGGGRRWREEVKKGRGEQGDKRWRVWWRWEKVAPRNGGFKLSTWKLYVCSGRWDQRPETRAMVVISSLGVIAHLFPPYH
uniref:Uncharacterized protein n=2 Tax=Oryza barthii TaxID=65489 RepID=A0A0D3F0T3_9ORYZ